MTSTSQSQKQSQSLAPLKLLHVVPTYLPAWRHGGPIHAVHGLCRALAARGHQVSVFTTNVHGPEVLPLTPGRPTMVEGIEVTYFPITAPRRIYRSPEMARALDARMRSFDITHLHSIFLWPTSVAARRAADAGVPYVLSPRGMLVRDLVRQRGRWRKTLWIQLFERRTIERAAALHATSRLEAEDATRFRLRLPAVRVVPNGVEVSAFRLKDWSDVAPRLRDLIDRRPYVLYLGRLSWKKGLDRLIEGLPIESDVDLVLAGPDDESLWPALRRRARERGIEGRVHYVGSVAGADKTGLLRAAMCLALPSSSENFGNSALEAMAASCPVVVSPGVGLADEIADSGAGLVVEPDGPALAASFAELLANPERRARMGQAGLRVAEENYSWPSVAERMEALYYEINPRAAARAQSPN